MRARSCSPGNTTARDQGDMPPGVLMASGDVTIYLEPGRGARESVPGTTAEFSPCFATDSVKASWQALRDAGTTIVEEYQEFGPEFALFKVADPDGNLIEFAGRP